MTRRRKPAAPAAGSAAAPLTPDAPSAPTLASQLGGMALGGGTQPQPTSPAESAAAISAGATGGAATHVHALSGTTGAAVNASTAGTSNNIAPSASHTHTYSGAFAAGNSLPAYYSVVFIIRIK